MNVPGAQITAGSISEETRPGAFKYFVDTTDAIAGVIYVCPCGCGAKSSLYFRTKTHQERPSWIWDGDEAAPTLSPSILRTSGCGWRGYLKAGVWESC